MAFRLHHNPLALINLVIQFRGFYKGPLMIGIDRASVLLALSFRGICGHEALSMKPVILRGPAPRRVYGCNDEPNNQLHHVLLLSSLTFKVPPSKAAAKRVLASITGLPGTGAGKPFTSMFKLDLPCSTSSRA